eukprot:CAMPEP_0113701950 /NCGR_PEP_ID=MMETSP0038_2-20120614/24881_1 /TAXON_ID=2898 /ORGANISM="Cryptomonas paramecium" /LENGTH=57 /DNA_ID=CAMNT_0000625943 /DNA_START=203 /DNA_END=376 /DNA_ORIENTATION=- /assembly_acc=CAM_ASM_000170
MGNWVEGEEGRENGTVLEGGGREEVFGGRIRRVFEGGGQETKGGRGRRATRAERKGG